MAYTTVPVKLGEGLTPEELIQAGLDLASLMEHPGWKTLVNLYLRWGNQIGLRAIKEEDPRFPAAYYRGQIDGTEEIFGHAFELVRAAQALKEDPRAREELRASRLGGGDTAD